LSGTSGNYLEWAGDFRIQGGVSTTDSNGAFSCASSNIMVPTSTFTYYGPTVRDPKPNFFGGSLLVMPELTNSYPNECIYAQCSYFQTGPPPIALTAVNEIVLPVLTLPRSTTEDSPETTTGPSTTTPTTTARPGPSEISQIPSQTSLSRTTDATTSSEHSDGPAPTNSPPASDGSPTTTASSDGPPPVIATPSENGGEDQETSSISPGSPGQGATTNRQSANNGSPTTTASSNGPPLVVAPPSDNGEEQQTNSNAPVIPAQGATTNPTASSNNAPPIIALPTQPSNNDQTPPSVIVVGGSTTISAGGQAAAASGTTFSVLPSAGGIIGVANGETTTLSLPTPAPAAISDFIRPVASAQQIGFIVPGPTITQGGEGVIISGTTYTALPSGSGVVAISEARSTTLQPSQLPGLGITIVPNDNNQGGGGGYAFPSQTLAVGGSAVVVSSATYSALPQGSSIGIVVAASGSSSTIAIPSEAATANIPGLGAVEILDPSSNSGEGVYVLSNSITLTAGGAPATISNTVYSALPSGFGVLVIPDGGDGGAEGDDFAAYIEQGVSGTDADGQQGESYIIGAELVSDDDGGAGVGSATTVAGVVYSALPSGSGVLVVVDGTSTTVAVSSTGDGGSDGQSTSTSTGGSSGGDEPEESVVAYAGTASAGRYGLGVMGWAGYVGVLVMAGMCLVR
jgi:hypothetical protein